MPTRIAIDGEVFDEAAARISVLDRGFLYGDSVYEVVRTYGGRPFALPEHLERLRFSAGQLRLELPVGDEVIAADIERTLAAAKNPESYVRIIVTRGAGEISLDPAEAVRPLRVVIVTELRGHPEALYREGSAIHLVRPADHSAADRAPGVKTGNYLANVLALGEARKRGAHEAILLDEDDRVAEGASSNIFVVNGGRIRTPPLDVGILEGITRRKVIAVAREAGYPVEETELRPADLESADEIFLTSTIREVLPVVRVGDKTVADGQPGAVARDLLTRYRQLARARS